MKLNCLIIDDEPLARDGLEKYVQQIEFLHLKAKCKSALQANGIIQQEKIDLIFLDIEMPQLSGLDFLKSLRQSPMVIFTTAYPQYALDGYQFDVIDYLLKPIAFERFLQAANKALRLHLKTIASTQEEEMTADFIFVKTDTQLVKVMLEDILYVEGMQNYIIFHTAKEKVMTLVPLKNIFEMLSSEAFVQVHRSYVVAKSKVEAIVGNQIIIGKDKVPISVRMRKKVMDELTGDRLLRK
ncbi:MAG: LytTR family DNA-binding domain-containing protein [Bacteroidota bacterium]